MAAKTKGAQMQDAGTENITINLRPADLYAMSRADRTRQGKPPMKETDEDKAVAEGAYRVTAAELRQFVEQVEQLESEKKDISEQIKEVFAEAKARGYDTKALREIIKLRKRDKDELAEAEAILELYKSALGMD